MPLITSLVSKLQEHFPELHFQAGADFHWSPSEKTVQYNPQSSDEAALLHEVAHGVLGHSSYQRDIELLERERSAWEYAQKEFSPIYGIGITEGTVQQALDTYRDWLHARSTCPTCRATGVQVKQHQYTCLACHTTWKVNDARLCALRRYTLSN